VARFKIAIELTLMTLPSPRPEILEGLLDRQDRREGRGQALRDRRCASVAAPTSRRAPLSVCTQCIDDRSR
jgi:hypothetical protein